MKYKYFIIVPLLSAYMTSCDLLGRIDDIEPEHTLTDETLITDAKSAETILNGVYETWREFNIGISRHSINVLCGTEANRVDITGGKDFSNADIKDDNIMVENIYTSLYKVVNMANSFISNMESASPQGLSENRKKEMLGEARFHRAFAHFQLLRRFGMFFDLASEEGIVVFLEPKRDNDPKERSSVSDAYKYIIDDLNYAITNAPEIAEGHYYVSRTVAKALKARVLLYMNDYKNAAIIANEVLSEAAAYGYELEEDYMDIFRQGYDSKEILFAPYTSYPNEECTIDLRSAKPGGTLKMVADKLVAGVGNEETGEGYDYRFAQIYASDYITAEQGEAPTSKYTNKYIQTSTGVGTPTNTHYFMRLAEVYLVLAEAEARENHLDLARKALKTITDRAGYDKNYVNTISDVDLKDYIRMHKCMELNAEDGEEWYDLVRYHVLDNLVLVPDYIKRDKCLIFPIPRTALAGNDLLEQNSIYK